MFWFLDFDYWHRQIEISANNSTICFMIREQAKEYRIQYLFLKLSGLHFIQGYLHSLHLNWSLQWEPTLPANARWHETDYTRWQIKSGITSTVKRLPVLPASLLHSPQRQNSPAGWQSPSGSLHNMRLPLNYSAKRARGGTSDIYSPNPSLQLTLPPLAQITWDVSPSSGETLIIDLPTYCSFSPAQAKTKES